jgi:LDH2 family malate/lactate/ureidoglycolate dehydrogenase
VYDLNNKPIPAGWVVDKDGQPVTDAAQAMYILRDQPKDAGGGLTPIGGRPEMSSHKGYGLSMLAHILGGTLSGASFSPIRVKTQKPQDPDNLGHFFMALDPKMFREEGAFEDDLDAAIDVLHSTKPVDPAEPVLVHGEPEARSREQRLREGIPIPKKLADQIRAISERAGVPYVLE